MEAQHARRLRQGYQEFRVIDHLKPLVVAAAVQTDDGVIHFMPRPHRHHHTVHALNKSDGPIIEARGVQGFVISDGTFADRVEAAAFAIAAGQLKKPMIAPPNLYSEDLW